MAGLFVVASSGQSLDTGGRCCGLMLEALGSDALVGNEGGFQLLCHQDGLLPHLQDV